MARILQKCSFQLAYVTSYQIGETKVVEIGVCWADVATSQTTMLGYPGDAFEEFHQGLRAAATKRRRNVSTS